MSQIIAAQNVHGIILAAENRALQLDEEGKEITLQVNRLIPLTSHCALLTAGAAEGTGMGIALKQFIKYARKPQAFKPGDEWHPFEVEPGGTWRSGANWDMIWLWLDTRLGPIRNTVCSTTWCGYRNIVGEYCEAKWSSA